MRAPLLLALGVAILPTAQPVLPDLSPGTRYDPAIPTLQQVVGHDFGEEITSPEQIEVYLRALAAAAPDRTRLHEYGVSWEGRPLLALIVGSPDRVAALERTRRDLQRLADPRALPGEDVDRLIDELPVVTVLMHAVHGAEISPGGAALAEAYHLLAATGDADVDAIRQESLVVIDPNLNPDGRARLVSQNLLARSMPPDPHPLSAEHDEPWPGARVNHYLFDLNRDWFAQTQIETRARVAMLRDMPPQVVVDLHEMGSGENTYFFPPPAPTDNPWLSPAQHRLFETFGDALADRFDERGFEYFTREEYTAGPNPASGSSWPLAHGAVAMLFEEATPISLVHRRLDGTLFSYRDGVLEHFTAALTTAAIAARHRERILRAWVDYRRASASAEPAGPRAYLLPPGRDPGLVARLGRMLLRNGVDVWRVDAPSTANRGDVRERTLRAGTLVVPLTQPAGRMARNLLDGDTTWSLPALLDLDVEAIDAAPDDGGTQSRLTLDAGSTPSALAMPDADVASAVAVLPPARVAYLLPWSVSTAGAVTAALSAGLRVRAGTAPFTLGGLDYPPGTAIVRTADHGPDLPARLGAIATRVGAQVHATDTGRVEAGMSLGSNRVRTVTAPRVLLAWDAPTFKYSAGWTRYVLERRYGQAVTIVRARTLSRVDLAEFDVVVLPAPGYDGVLGSDTVGRLRAWMELGGTLVTLGDATRWAASEEVGLLDADVTLVRGSAEQYADAVSTAMLRAELDTGHWLSFGTDGQIQMLSSTRRAIAPRKGSSVRIVARYAATDPVIAGRVPAEIAGALAGAGVLAHERVGRGHVVAFAEEPNAFGYAETTQLVFMNAVLLGPAQLRP